MFEDHSHCCGCSACAQICPKNCIEMRPDSEGFLFPYLVEADCIHCGLCDRVCPSEKPFDLRRTNRVYAAINNDSQVRAKSSSGGVFSALAELVINQGGVVFGAKFTSDWQVVLDFTEVIDGIASFRGSKYVQASVGTAYMDCERILQSGRIVLFSATPCQIAGLKHFLRKDYSNLLTVDFVCHGTPSPKVWASYIAQITNGQTDSIKDIFFRDKSILGWKQFHMTFEYSKDDRDSHSSVVFSKDPYMRSFLANLILRRSCYSCDARENRSHSDITLADFWGVEIECPQMDDDKGTSAVLINSDNGMSYWSLLNVSSKEVSYESVCRHNPSLVQDCSYNTRRDDFFRRVSLGESINHIIMIETRPSFLRRVLRYVKRHISKVMLFF